MVWNSQRLASFLGCAASTSLGQKYFVQRELGRMVGIGVDYVDRKVLAKYNLNKKVGRGLYGIVWKAQAKTDNRERAVAIKRLFNAFSNNIDAKRTYREVSYLLSFCNHPNIVSVHEVIASSEDMDLYLVMEHIDVDLSSVIPSMCKIFCV
jgi:serine/threonine protein kinase